MKIIEHNWNWAHGLSSRSRTDAIVLHHAAAKTAAPEDVHRWHLNNGWAGFGYHLYIRKDGSVHRGRPIWASGAHTLNFNSTTLGVCCEGNYNEETVMPVAQLQALREVLAYLKQLYPAASIKCHRDYNATACPGKWFPLGEALRYGQAPAPVSTPATNNTKEVPKMDMLRKGSKGYQVKVLQMLLILNGCSCGSCGADGDFGPATDAAVRKFQKAKRLEVDGIVGPKTWAALLGC